MAFLLQQVSGINAVIYYAPRILHSSGYGSTGEQLLGTVGIGAINVVMTFVAILAVDRLGRRPLFILAFVGTALSLLVIAWAMGSGVPPAVGLIGLFAYIAVFAMSLGPLPWLYMSELFPLQLRSRGMALASVTNWSFNFLVVFLFPVASKQLGTMATMLVFASFCAAGVVYAWFWAPETKGESLEALETRLAVPAQFGRRARGRHDQADGVWLNIAAMRRSISADRYILDMRCEMCQVWPKGSITVPMRSPLNLSSGWACDRGTSRCGAADRRVHVGDGSSRLTGDPAEGAGRFRVRSRDFRRLSMTRLSPISISAWPIFPPGPA